MSNIKKRKVLGHLHKKIQKTKSYKAVIFSREAKNSH